MNRLRLLSSRSIATLALFAIVAILGNAFWASAGVSTDCTVCHKRTQTITLGCNTLEYRRHLDHGDAMGACAVTPTDNP
jgi:hypothetical protein